MPASKRASSGDPSPSRPKRRSDGSRRSPRKQEWFDDIEQQMTEDVDLHDPDLETRDVGLAKLPEDRSLYYCQTC
ncbi:unnamed protein product [Sympodiomycopsis kandeliae]